MKKQRERGFTLIELLITVFILSVVLLAISSMVYSVMRATSNSKETSTATTLMQDKMETLKNISSASLTPGSWSDTVPQGNINYNRTWSITRRSTPPPPDNYITISVTVSWTNRGAHTVTMTTLRGD